MDIETRTQRQPYQITIRQLQCGTVFKTVHVDNEYYLKVDEHSDMTYEAVNLANGMICYFDDFAEVIPLNAKIVIED